MTKKRIPILLVAITLIVALLLINAATTSRGCIDETGITNGVGDCYHLDGRYVVAIDGTFDGASVTLEKIHRDNGTQCANPVKVKDIGVPSLVDVVVETEYIGMDAGEGYYQVVVGGGGGGELIGVNICKVGG